MKRQVDRLTGALFRWPAAVKSYFYQSMFFDPYRDTLVRKFKGQQPFAERMAVYLIFPKDGIIESHLSSIKYLKSKGYAINCVSNAPLSLHDRELLLGYCWGVMERPNFGYDFGGYRDAVLDLQPSFPKLERLVVLNDSTWFPLPGANDWLDDVDALNVTFAAASSNYGIARPRLKSFPEIRWTYGEECKDFHYSSYAFSVGSDLLRRDSFLEFWQHLRLYDNRWHTVLSGEIGFSKFVSNVGVSHAATLDLKNLDVELFGLDDSRLLEIARNLVVLNDPRLLTLKVKQCYTYKGSRSDIAALILYTVARQGAIYGAPDYFVNERKFPFLKKSPVYLSQDSSDATLRTATKFRGFEGDLIRAEISKLRSEVYL